MKLLTMSELSNRTQTELLSLQNAICAELGALAEGSAEHAAAETTLDNIRAVLARRPLRPAALTRPSPG